MRTLAPAVAGLALAAFAGRARPAPPPLAHVFVALCDNDHQGIVPVSRTLGDGDDPVRNLYWGARHGMRTFLERAPGWRRLRVERPTGGPVLERVVFRHQPTGLVLVADGYRGREIAAAMRDFLLAAAGRGPAEVLELDGPAGQERLALAGAGLVAYVGHDGLMDGDNPEVRALLGALPEQARGAPGAPGAPAKAAMVIACASRDYFTEPLRRAGAAPWLLTTGLLPAEAYSLEAAAVVWAAGGTPADAREATARALARWQRCSLAAARRLFAGGPTVLPAGRAGTQHAP